MIYLDNSATTPVKKEVLDVIINTMQNCWGNPSSSYEFGLETKRIIEDARLIIAQSINAEPEEIIFTSGASEANSLAISGFLNYHENNDSEYPYFITSNIEHSSIPLFNADAVIDVDYYFGSIDIDTLERKLSDLWKNSKKLVSIQAANNEIGVIHNLRAISNVVHKYNGVFHTDATQYYPHYKIDVKAIGIDMMSVSGHKFGCPKGIGFLYVKKGINLSPIIYGTQNNGLRGGTENVPYIVGLAKAVELLDYSQEKDLKTKRDYCLDEIYNINFDKEICLNGDIKNRLPHNINIRIEDADAQMLIALLDLNGICVSAGSACHAGDKEPSHVLKAIGLSDKEAKESIRITISNDTTYEEIDKFVETLQMILTQILG